MESVDYSDSDYRYEIEGEVNRDYDRESFAENGYQTGSFSEDGELVADEEDDAAFEEEFDAADGLDEN